MDLNSCLFLYKMQTIRYTLGCGTVHVLKSDHWMIYKSLDFRFLSSFVLLGDFNVDFYNHQHPLFYRILHSFVLTQIIPEPTHINPSGSSTVIDLALLSAPSQLVNCNVIPPLSNSDHNGFTLTLKWSRNPLPVKARKRSIWKYAQADFEKGNRLIETADWTPLYNESNTD